MNTKLFLLMWTSLSFLPQLTFAQCVATQDCATLGYTETSCSGSKGIKCPFGNKWACLPTKEAICKEEGFTLACNGTGQIGSGDSCNGLYKKCSCNSNYKYTCSGTGYSGGSGTACDGTYTACTCTSGYEWKNGTCTKINTCTIGALYYSDGTCSTNKVSGKTLLGVVIYSNGASGGGWIMTINPIQTDIAWGGYGTDISSLPNYTNRSSAAKDLDSCGNTDKIRAQGNSSTYPAAWAAYNYQPSGTPAGKRWCLPAAGLINSLYNNLSTINTGIATAGGTKLEGDNEQIWSSSEYGYRNAWILYTNSAGGLGANSKDDASEDVVRPVLAF